MTQQAESLYELQDRVKLEIGAREQCEVKIQDMRKEKQLMENDMLQQKETIEAFQVRTIPWGFKLELPTTKASYLQLF